MVSFGRVLEAVVLQMPYNVITVKYFRQRALHIITAKQHFKALVAAINQSYVDY